MAVMNTYLPGSYRNHGSVMTANDYMILKKLVNNGVAHADLPAGAQYLNAQEARVEAEANKNRNRNLPQFTLPDPREKPNPFR